MMLRRPLLILCLCAAMAAIALPHLMGQNGGPASPATAGPAAATSPGTTSPVLDDPFQKDQVDAAIKRGVEFLITQQQKNGSFQDRNQHANAMTGLALLAISSIGHLSTDPTPEGQAIRRGLDFLLTTRQTTRNAGYFGAQDGSRMYGQGIVTLCLSELLGMGVDEEHEKLIRDRLNKALGTILGAQRVPKDGRYTGGWRYEPSSSDADLSITVWQVMALRSAYNAGIDVPKSSIDEAAAYIRRSYRSRLDAAGKPVDMASAYAYQPGGSPEFATASAGMLAMQVCAKYDDPTVLGTAEWLLKHKPNYNQEWFFYGTYYYAQCMFQRGGKYADEARTNVREILLPRQRKEGSWEAGHGSERDKGHIYATSLGILSLSVKYHYLPIYQK